MSQSASQQQVGHLAKGDVVSVPIPFPDQEGKSKQRPALILMRADGDNYVVWPFTTKPNREHKILVGNKDFQIGRFDTYEASYLRPNLLHTINKTYITKKYGTLKDETMKSIIDKSMELMNRPREDAPVPRVLERPKAPTRVR